MLIYDPSGRIKVLLSGMRSGLSAGAAYELSVALVRPLSSNKAFIEAVARVLADEQLDWQNHRTTPIQEAALLRSLNRNLALEEAPEYMQLRLFEFRKVRVVLAA